jgi:hypothetical protein
MSDKSKKIMAGLADNFERLMIPMAVKPTRPGLKRLRRQLVAINLQLQELVMDVLEEVKHGRRTRARKV